MRITYSLLLVGSLISLTGCQSYVYRVIQPPGITQRVADQPVLVRYDPLDYRLTHHNNRLSIRIFNPTDDRIVLLSDRSYVVDPQGESHPFRGGVLGPHSFTELLLPPSPITYAYPDYSWGWAAGWPPYHPYWGPFWGPAYYGPPPLTYHEIPTQYDWTWKSGPARLRLTYERNQRTFDQDFELLREPQK